MEPVYEENVSEMQNEQGDMSEIEQPSNFDDKCVVNYSQNATCTTSIIDSDDCCKDTASTSQQVDSYELVIVDKVDLVGNDNNNSDGVDFLKDENKEALPVQSKEATVFNISSSNNNSYLEDLKLINFDVDKSESDKVMPRESTVADDLVQPSNDNRIDYLIDKSISISKEVDLKIIQSLNDRDNYLYEKTFISNDAEENSSKYYDEMTIEEFEKKYFPDCEIVTFEISGTTPLEFIQKMNPKYVKQCKDETLENETTDTTNTGNPHKIEKNTDQIVQIDKINKLQNMTWLKSQSNFSSAAVSPHSKLTLKSLPKKEDNDESYYEGTRKNSNKKRHNKKPSVANDAQPLAVEESSDNSLDGNCTQQSLDIDRIIEEEQLTLALVESVKTAQEENLEHKMVHVDVKVQVHDDDNWENIEQITTNLPEHLENDNNNQTTDEKPCDDTGRVDDHAEKNMDTSKETKLKEQETLDEASSNNSAQPIVPFARWPYSHNKNKVQGNSQVKQNFNYYNRNSERPIHGRSGKDVDFVDSQHIKAQKLEPIKQNPNRSQQNQNHTHKGLENQRIQSSHSQSYPNNPSNKNNSDNYQENSKQTRFTRQPFRNEDNKNPSNNSRAQGNQNLVQSNINKDQFNTSRTQSSHNAVQESASRHDRNQNYFRNYESVNNQNSSDRNKDMTFRNRDQKRHQNNFDKNNQDAKQNQRYPYQVNRQEIKSTVGFSEELWDEEIPNKKVVEIPAKQTKEKTYESAQSLSNITAKRESQNAASSQNKRRGSKNSLNQKDTASAVNKESKTTETVPSLDQSKSSVSAQNKKHESNSLSNQKIANLSGNKENQHQVMTSADQAQSNINQNISSSGLKSNLVIAFEGNQNVQRVLGMDPSSHASLNTSAEVSISTTLNSTSKSSYISTEAAQNINQSQSSSSINYSLPSAYGNASVNINAQPFQSTNYTQNQDNQNSAQAIPSITEYFSAKSSIIPEDEYKATEMMQLMEKMLKETELVKLAKTYLASAEANLLSTKTRLEEFTLSHGMSNSHGMDNLSNVVACIFNNLMMKSQGNSSSLVDQPAQYSIPPGFSASLPNMQRANQTEDNFIQPSTPSNLPGEAFIHPLAQMQQRMNILPYMFPQHRPAYQAIPHGDHTHCQHDSSLITAPMGIPLMNVSQISGSREVKSSDNQYYNQ